MAEVAAREQQRMDGEEGVFGITLRVQNHDIDAGRVVYAGNYMKYMEQARVEWLRGQGISLQYLERDLRLGFVATEYRLRYFRPAYLDEVLRVTVRLSGITRSSVSFHQTVERDGVLFKGDMHARFPSGRPSSIPRAIREQLEPLVWRPEPEATA